LESRKVTVVTDSSMLVFAKKQQEGEPMTTKTKHNEIMSLLSQTIEQGHGDRLRELLSSMLKLVMEAEVSEICGAGYTERSEERINTRNGYRERPLETRLGTVGLPIPEVREGSYFPSFLELRRRWERAFVNVVAEAYVQGVSTRRIENLV